MEFDRGAGVQDCKSRQKIKITTIWIKIKKKTSGGWGGYIFPNQYCCIYYVSIIRICDLCSSGISSSSIQNKSLLKKLNLEIFLFPVWVSPSRIHFTSKVHFLMRCLYTVICLGLWGRDCFFGPKIITMLWSKHTDFF